MKYLVWISCLLSLLLLTGKQWSNSPYATQVIFWYGMCPSGFAIFWITFGVILAALIPKGSPLSLFHIFVVDWKLRDWHSVNTLQLSDHSKVCTISNVQRAMPLAGFRWIYCPGTIFHALISRRLSTVHGSVEAIKDIHMYEVFLASFGVTAISAPNQAILKMWYSCEAYSLQGVHRLVHGHASTSCWMASLLHYYSIHHFVLIRISNSQTGLIITSLELNYHIINKEVSMLCF